MNDMTRRRAYRGPRLLSQGFRPFFLAAAVWAALAQAIWLGMLAGRVDPPTAFDPVSWHVHEMIFGFIVATIAGFMLTAIPNWTGRLPVRGAPLAGLALIWLAGRLAVLVSATIGAGPAAAIDLAFLVAFCLVASRELVAGKNWRNLPMAAALAVLAAANAAMHAEVAGWADLDGASWRLALAVVVMLVGLVGGRIIPSFTRNWLAKNGGVSLPAPFGPVDGLAQSAAAAGLAAWTLAPDAAVSGALLLAGGALQGARLLRWRGGLTGAEPLVLILHVAYAWAPLGMSLLGAAVLLPDLAATGLTPMLGVHALTVGLAGGMILAVMTRATLGHTGRPLHADRLTTAIYVTVNLAALARLAAEVWTVHAIALIDASGFLWIGAFALFALHYGRFLLGHSKGISA